MAGLRAILLGPDPDRPPGRIAREPPAPGSPHLPSLFSWKDVYAHKFFLLSAFLFLLAEGFSCNIFLALVINEGENYLKGTLIQE